MENKIIKYFFLLFLIFTFPFTIIFFCKNKANASPPSTLNTGTLHQDGQILWGGQDRYYYYYEPNDPGASPRPLIILLHGGGGNIDSFLGLDGKKAPFKIWLDVADEEKLYLAIPQGHNKSWNDCRGDCQTCSTEDDVGFLNEMINQLMNKYEIDTTRIYATGESNGGHMSYRLAMELSHRIAAVGVVIAGFPAQNECFGPVDPVSVLIMNGTEDPICPWEGGEYNKFEGRGTVLSAYESVNFWVNHNNCDTIPESYDFADGPYEDSSTVHRDIYDNGIQNTEVVLYRVDGGGHNSPSIAQQYADWFLTLAGLGAQNHDIEMAREVWDLFKRHTLITSVTNSSDDLSIKTFYLSQNYPNPFNPTTTIQYHLPQTGKVTLRIYNLLGELVQTLVDEVKPPGVYKIDWDGKNSQGLQVGGGLYMVRMKVGGFVQNKKIVLLR
ncbi:MAG: FlgD immunoglobulin-like domain containing protein [bacterium]